MPALTLLQAALEAVTAVAHAAQMPDEVKISHEGRERAREIGRGAYKLADALQAQRDALSQITGPVDTLRERHLRGIATKAFSKAQGWRAKLVILGLPESLLPDLPTTLEFP